MKAAIAALTALAFDFARSFNANTTIDASDYSSSASRAARKRSLAGINNSRYLGLGRKNGKLYHFVQLSDWNAKLVAARLALDVLAVDTPRDAAGFRTFAVCDSRPAGVSIVEDLNVQRSQAMGADGMTDREWRETTIAPEHYGYTG